MAVDIVIENGQVVLPSGVVSAGIAVDKEKIVAIAKDEDLPQSDKVIDAKGNYVIPGLVDSHVHYGWPAPELGKNLRDETQAFASGGVTTALSCILQMNRIV